jgi:hypothetical protein
MVENNVQKMQLRTVITFAIVFFIIITIVTLIPVPAAVGYVFAFVFGKRYMRSALQSNTVTLARTVFLGAVCGLASLIGLFALHNTILFFLPSAILFLAIGAAGSFWVGNLFAYREMAERRMRQ